MIGWCRHLIRNHETSKSESMSSRHLNLEGGHYELSGFDVTIRVRRTGAVFSNLRAARYFCRKLKKYEDEYAGKEFGSHVDPASFYFFAAITASVATLETYYNALIEDIKLEKGMIELLEKADLMTKFYWLLKLEGKAPIEKGKEPAQSLKDLLTLRNCSVHYRPRWDDDAVESRKLEEQFRGRNIETSPLFPDNMPFFPYRCCSHAYAEWAIRTVKDFLKEFAQRMGLEIKWLQP